MQRTGCYSTALSAGKRGLDAAIGAVLPEGVGACADLDAEAAGGDADKLHSSNPIPPDSLPQSDSPNSLYLLRCTPGASAWVGLFWKE